MVFYIVPCFWLNNSSVTVEAYVICLYSISLILSQNEISPFLEGQGGIGDPVLGFRIPGSGLRAHEGVEFLGSWPLYHEVERLDQ